APPLARSNSLLLINKVAAAVLLPTGFVVFQAERFLLAVADCLDTAGVHSGRGQGILHRTGALVSQGQIVLGRAAVIAMSLDRKVDVGMLVEKKHVGLYGSLLIGAYVGLVVVEINVLDALTEQILVR